MKASLKKDGMQRRVVIFVHATRASGGWFLPLRSSYTTAHFRNQRDQRKLEIHQWQSFSRNIMKNRE